MKYLVFWYLALPVMLVAMIVDWGRGIKPVSSLAWAGVIVVAQIAGWIKDRQDTKAGERANDRAVRCKHGIKTWHSCKNCAEEFAYFETCKLCGYTWDNRVQQHDHQIIPDPNGRPEYFLNGVKQQFMVSGSYWATGYPAPFGSSLSYLPGMSSLAIDTRERAPQVQVAPVAPSSREMKLILPESENKA